MKQPYEILKDKSIIIKNEVEDGANTSSRIGGLMEDIVDTMDDSIKSINKLCDDNAKDVDKITPIVLSESEYENLPIKDPDIFYMTYEEE